MDKSLADLLNRTYRNPESGCWEYQKSKTWCGYGRLSTWRGRRGVLAHRASYEALVGPVPDGAVVMHACDNPCCINPGHLSLGTQSDNCRDRNAKGRAVDNSGTANGRARLAPKDVIFIRSSTDGLASLARRFGVGKTTIEHIRKGRTWKHV
jgi:hypothetical protein